MVKSLGLLVLAFTLGIIFGSYISLSIYFLLLLLITFGVSYFLLWRKGIGKGLTFIPLLIFFVFGCYQISLHQLKPDDSKLLPYTQKKGVEVTGTIISDPSVKNDYVRCNVRVEKLRYRQDTFKNNETLLLMVRLANSNCNLFYGQRIKVSGTLKLPPTASNPGEFSYRKYLARQNIFAILQIHDNRQIRIMGLGNVNRIILFAYKLKKKMTGAFALSIPEPYCSLLQGIVFGGSSNIPEKMQKDFQNIGLTHILAVSGANLAFILTVFLGVGALCRIPSKFNLVTAALGIIIYALATGFGPSVERASLMMLLGLVGLFLGREKDIYISLWIAAFFILWHDPASLFDPGFQFSFAATLSIIAFTPILQERISFLPKGMIAFFAVPIVAQLGVLPLQLFYFGQLSSISIIANLLIAPLFGLTVQVGFLTGLLGLFSGMLAKIFNTVNLLLLIVITKMVELLAAIPGSVSYIKQINIFWIIFYYACLLWLFIQLRNGNLATKVKLTKEKLLIFMLIIFLAFVVQGIFNSNNGMLKVTYLDVGQGDASVIQTPAGKVILVDGGDNTGGYDRSEKVIIPFLRRNGIKRIDLLFLTHPHNDHLGGLPTILKDIKVGSVFDTGQVSANPNYREFLRLIKEEKIKYYPARRGCRILLDNGIRLQIIHPDKELLKDTSSDCNNNSIVFRLTFKKMSFLFTGDIEGAAENVILNDKKVLLRSEILKAAHHGSATSSGNRFLAAVKPRIAVISVGRNNHFGHPAGETLARLKRNGIKYYRTDLNGAVEVKTDGIAYTVNGAISK